MTTFRVDLDTSGLDRMLGQLTQRGLAFATANALNETAKLVQRVERERLGQRFELRTPRTKAFLERQVAVIKPFASPRQGAPFAEVSVGRAPRLLLPTFEAGGDRVSSTGARRVGVPITGGPARPTFSSPVEKRLYLSKLRFEPAAKKGRRRTAAKVFLVRKSSRLPDGGVFQRTGAGREDVRLVYSFQRRPRLRPTLAFVATAQDVARRWMRREFEEQLSREIARARGKR